MSIRMRGKLSGFSSEVKPGKVGFRGCGAFPYFTDYLTPNSWKIATKSGKKSAKVA
jgi:hypothetical protein